MEIEITTTVKVSKCYHECPYFGLDGGLMYCDHPYFKDKDFNTRFIIEHPDCDNGFPPKCPLVLDYELFKREGNGKK